MDKIISALEIGLQSTTDLMSEAPRRAQVELSARANVIKAAIASAAAPQVVADDRELPDLPSPASEVEAWVTRQYGTKTGSEVLESNGEYFTADQMRDYARAALAAAPVQAQEPFAWYVETEGVWGQERFTQIDPGKTYARVTPLYTAPVQPVAVPDGDLRDVVGKVIKAMESSAAPVNLAHALREVSDQCGRIDFDPDLMAELLAAYSAAPAAQGDAKDAERYRYIRDTGTLEAAVWAALEGYGCADEGDIDQVAYAAGMDQAIDAAIAAKAAS